MQKSSAFRWKRFSIEEKIESVAKKVYGGDGIIVIKVDDKVYKFAPGDKIRVSVRKAGVCEFLVVAGGGGGGAGGINYGAGGGGGGIKDTHNFGIFA